MNIGLIFLGADMNIQALSRLATEAESNGFSTLCVAEAWRSGWIALTAMAAATSTIRLGPYVLNAYGRSPLFTGMSAIDFNEFSNGRLLLGVGGGNRTINEQWQGIPHARVLRKMREYVEVLQGMARAPLGQPYRYSGDIHEMEWTPAVQPHPSAYPVYLAAVFPRMLTVAAQVADGIGGGATLSPGYLRDTLRPFAAEAAQKIGRDPSSLKWNAVGVTSVHADRERARRSAREAICHFYAPLPHPYYEYTMREQGFGDVADVLLKKMPAGDLEGSVAAIGDDCLDTLTIAGTEDECRAKIRAYDDVLDELLLLNVSPSDGNPQHAYENVFRLAKR